MAEGRPFDLCGELPPPGVTVLEASAGTGKTYALAGLVTRFVAEGGAKLTEVLAVSFTRAAAGELKERVRARLVSAEACLARLLELGESPPPGDALLAHLALRGPASGSTCPGQLPHRPDGPEATSLRPADAGGDHELTLLRERRRLLSEALATFDAATITTTHGFCYMVLGALGVWGEFSPGAALLEDPRDLVEDVLEELYARWVARWGDLPFSPKEALTVAREAVDNAGAALEPPADERDGTPGGLRRRLAKRVRDEVARRLVDANVLTYDGMLLRLAEALADPHRGQAARRRLAERYRVVLVDEFQDTDLVQWDVVHRAFASSGAHLILIGDPKQAIYAFRGADVYAYLAARRSTVPANRFTLERNWRCDADLGAALDALFDPLQFGNAEIVYRPVSGTCQHPNPGIAPPVEPLRLRWLDRSQGYLGQRFHSSKAVTKNSAEQLVAVDVAAEIDKLVASGAQIAAQDQAGTKPLEPGDVAVLVRTNEQATLVQKQLISAGIPAVVSTSRSVMSTPAARDWLLLLDALQQPSSRSLAASVALGAFFGKPAEALASGDERFWEAVHARLHEWAAVLQRAGVAGLFAEACASEELPKRLLSEVQGERRLTDLAHIAELLHAEARRSQLGPAALRAWLARRKQEATSERAETEELCRRLDSDAKAVQILTVHRAKGLEFPVVYCPYFWTRGKRPRSGEPVSFHDRLGTSRKLDVGGDDGPCYEEHFKLAQNELEGEDLRQMYVAATRAKHMLVIWWVPGAQCQRSPFGRLLLSPRDADGALGEPRPKEPSDKEVAAALNLVAARAPGLVRVEQMSSSQLAARGPARGIGPPKVLAVMPFERPVDTSWARLSYSSITASAHGHAPVGSEPEEPGTYDEPPDGDQPAPVLVASTSGDGAAGEESVLRSFASPWAAIPAGASAGTFLHRVLQLVDFTAPELTSSLTSVVNRYIETYPGDPDDAPRIVTALEIALNTPLGPLAGGLSLRGIRRADRLDELGFELPLAGGETPAGEVTTADLADAFSVHVRPGEPLWAYTKTLRGHAIGTTLRGYLNGSLDLAFRTVCEGGPRYFVVDYKTNWLAPPGEALSAWHYRPAALEAEMCRSHYVLQALFYLVALHRYLRWRLPGYRPEEHLGGVLYLFVRGMCGPDQPTVAGHPCGVFSWRPPAALVQNLSDLLASKSAS